jgi:hypothetical protein
MKHPANGNGSRQPSQEEIQKRYWTAKDVARYLNVHFTTVYGWVTPSTKNRPPKLIGPPPPHRRFGPNCIRFPIEEFKKWAADSRYGEN